MSRTDDKAAMAQVHFNGLAGLNPDGSHPQAVSSAQAGDLSVPRYVLRGEGGVRAWGIYPEPADDGDWCKHAEVQRAHHLHNLASSTTPASGCPTPAACEFHAECLAPATRAPGVDDAAIDRAALALGMSPVEPRVRSMLRKVADAFFPLTAAQQGAQGERGAVELPDPAGLRDTFSALSRSKAFTLEGFLEDFGHEDEDKT